MKRHYFVSNDLGGLESIEVELERCGIHKPQIHVLSKDDTAVAHHKHLHNIEAVFKQDVVNGMMLGAMFGLLAATVVMTIGLISELPATYTWTPFYFLALIMFGFLTWSGDFYGIQTPHKDFRHFQKALDQGKHIFIVDVDPSQEAIIQQIQLKHPHLSDAGTGISTPRWVVMGQQNFKSFTSSTFP